VLHSIFSQLSLFLEAGNQATASGARLGAHHFLNRAGYPQMTLI
jgi:hypothetical protein